MQVVVEKKAAIRPPGGRILLMLALDENLHVVRTTNRFDGHVAPALVLNREPPTVYTLKLLEERASSRDWHARNSSPSKGSGVPEFRQQLHTKRWTSATSPLASGNATSASTKRFMKLDIDVR